MADYTVWNSIPGPNLEVKDEYVSKKVTSLLKPYILPDDVIYHIKNVLQKEIYLGLSNSEESSLPMNVTFLTERFKEYEGEYVSICINFNLVTITLVRLKSGVSLEIQRKGYNMDASVFNKPYLKIFETFTECIKDFFYEFQLDGKTVPIGFCSDFPMKQLNINTAIIPYFSKEHLQACEKDVKTYFEHIMHKEAFQKKDLFPVHSTSPVTIPQANENSLEGENRTYDAKFLGTENVLGLNTNLELCHKILSKMQASFDTGKPLQDVTLEISHVGIKVKVKGLEDILYQHYLKEISHITQDYIDFHCFGYLCGDYVKGHQLFGFKTECKSTEIVLSLKDTFENELIKTKKEELNMKASQVLLELKDFLNLPHKLKAMEREIPVTLKKRVELVEDIRWWLEGCGDDVLASSFEPEESNLNVKIQELYTIAVEMKLAKIEEQEEIQKKIDKANKKHRKRKKEEDKKSDDPKRKKVPLHPNQVKVSQLIKEHVAYFQALLNNRNKKIEVLKEQISKVDEINIEDNSVEEACDWLKSFCNKSYHEEMKKELDILKKKAESLILSENSERKNIQFSEPETVIEKQQHLRTLQRKPDEPIFEDFNLKIPERYDGKLEILRKIISSKRMFLSSLKVRTEEVEQLNCFISELYFKANRIPHEESNAVVTSRKILTRAVKLRLKEIENCKTSLENFHVVEENLTYVVPNILQFCKQLYDNTLQNLEKKIKQLQEIVSRNPESSEMHVSHIDLCKEVYCDVRNVIENEIKEVEQIIVSLQSEENALDLNVKSVCFKLYADMSDKRKKEFDELVKNLHLLDETRINDLDEEDTSLTTNLKEFFLASIVIREKEIEWLEKEMCSGKDASLKQDSNVVVHLKDLFTAALELEKRHYEKILFVKEQEEDDEVLPVIYPLIDLFDIVIKGLKKKQIEKSKDSASYKKLQIHTSLGEFLSVAFDLKQKEFEIPLNELKQDFQKVLSNMIREVKKQENQCILERNIHFQALKILNSWKELFLIAADIRRCELMQVIHDKIKNLKEEQANIRAIYPDKLSDVKDKGQEIALFWQQILSNVVNMKKKEIIKIQQLLDNPNTFLEEKDERTSVDSKSNLETLYEEDEHVDSERREGSSNSEIATTLNKSKQILNKVCSSFTKFESEKPVTGDSLNRFQRDIHSRTSLSHLEAQQPYEKENFLKIMELKDLLNSLEHKRLKQPIYNISNWNDIIVRSFLIEKLDAAKMTIGEESNSMDDELNSKYNLANAFQSEYTWEEILVEASNLHLKEKELSQLLKAKKEIYIPLVPWTDVFEKAIYTWNEQINIEVNAKQNENILLQWKARMDPKQHSEFVAGCNYEDVSKSFHTLSNEDIENLEKSMDTSVDITELKETLCASNPEQNSMADSSQVVTDNMLWENIFQESVNVITKSNDVANILKKQDLNIQYKAARIHSSWNEYFIKMAERKKKESENVVQHHTVLDKLSKSVHEKMLVASPETPLMSEPSLPTWTSKALAAFEKHKKELVEAVSIKESEMDLRQTPESIEFETKLEDNPLLNTEPGQLILHGKRMFLIALELRKAEVKAMEEELMELKNADVFHERDAIKSMDIWKKIISSAVDLKLNGIHLKQPNKIRHSKSSETLFFLAVKILTNELEMNITPEKKTERIHQNFKLLDEQAESSNWDVLFQKAYEFIIQGVEKMERLGLKEMKKKKSLSNNAPESNDDTDMSDWTKIFIEAVEQTIKEMNPDQLNIQDILENDLLIQPLPSWNEIFFIMLNYTKYGIQDKLISDSCFLPAKEDLANVQLLGYHNVLSWDDLLIAAIEDYLRELSDNSHLSDNLDPSKIKKHYESNLRNNTANINYPENNFGDRENGKGEIHTWIDLLPTKNGADKFQAKKNLLETEIKILHHNPVFKPEKIPDDIIWKHLFPLAVIVWRRKMAYYLNFSKLASSTCTSSHKNSNLSEAIKIESTDDRRNTTLVKDLSSHLEYGDIENLKPEYFSISISWREIFFAALERKRKILCKLIELKETDSTNVDQKPSNISAEKLESITFSANKVLDLPITQHELVKAYNILKLKKLVLHNEKTDEHSNEDSEIRALQVEDIKPFAVIDAFKSILSEGMHLRNIETSILQQELLKIENLPQKNKMALSSLKTLKKYYSGAIEFRQNENKKIDYELAILKDVKDIFSEYVDFGKSNSVYQRNKIQGHLIKKILKDVQKIKSDFDQKLVVHLNQCILDCKALIDKKNSLNLEIDMKTVEAFLEKLTLKNQELLVDSVIILRKLSALRKEDLEYFESELELMKRKETFKSSLESKVSDTFDTVLDFLSDASFKRNNLIDLLSHNIEALKQVEYNMDAKVHIALSCCKDYFSKAIQSRKSEIIVINSEISHLKSNLNTDGEKVLEVLSMCEHYCEKATSKRNLELQKLDSYVEQISSAQVTDCHYICTKYFTTASDKRKQEINEIQALMEPLKKLESDQEKDTELSSALDETLCNVFGIEPEVTRLEKEKSEIEDTTLDPETLKKFTDFFSKLLSYTQSEFSGIEEKLKVLGAFKGEIAEEPIEILGNFIAMLITENETVKTEIETLDSEIKIFKTNQEKFEIDMYNILTTCHNHLTHSLDNTKEEIDELNFQLKVLYRGLNENNEAQFEKLSHENLHLTNSIPAAFDALQSGQTSDETDKLSKTFTEVAIEKMQSAVKWRKYLIKTLTDDIKFLLDFNDKPIQILSSCNKNFSFVCDKRKEENSEISNTLNEYPNRKNEESLKEVVYLNNKALTLIGDEQNRLTQTFEFLQNQKKDIYNFCEEIISHVISKREEEIQSMNSDLSHLQIMGSTEDTELLSNCKSSLKNGVEERISEVKLMKKDLKHWPIETENLPFVTSYGEHLRSCLEKKESEVENVLKLLKSLKEEGNISILLYSPILESISNKNNADYEWLQLEISKFVHIHEELDLQGKRIIDGCHKLYCNLLENFKIEIEGILYDIECLQEQPDENPENDELEDQQAIANFNHLFMSVFNLKKKELERDAHRVSIQGELQRKQMNILIADKPDAMATNNENKEFRSNYGETNVPPSKMKKKETVYEVTSLTQLNPYFDRLKEEKKVDIEKKVVNEFQDLEQKLSFNQEIYFKVPQSEKGESVRGSESGSKTEAFTNRVYEIKVQQIEEDINLKRNKIQNVIIKRKYHMDAFIKSKRQEMEDQILSKETKIRQTIDLVQNEDSQIVCSLKDIFHDAVELKNKERYTLQNVQQLDKYKDKELEALNVLVNLDNIFSVALSLKEEEIAMIKYSNFKEIDKSVLLMKKECEKIVGDAKSKLEEALVKYREHEKSRALIYTGLVKASKGTSTEEYIIDDEQIFPDIKAFEDFILTINKRTKQSLQVKQLSKVKNAESSTDIPFHIPYIRPYTYASHGLAGQLLKLYKNEVQSLTKVSCDITTEIDCAIQNGVSFKVDELSTNQSVVAEQKEIQYDIVAILNSNTSMLMMGSSMDVKCDVALNLGQDFGLVYFQQTSEIQKWISPKPDAKEISIEVGFKKFTFKDYLDSISTKFDWDVTTVPFCTSRFQRFISDAGLLEQIRFILLELHHQHLFCRKCDMGSLSDDTGLRFEALHKFLSTTNVTDALQSMPIRCGSPSVNDVNVAIYVTKLVLIRGALLTSICLAPILERSNNLNIGVITNSLFIQKLSEYQSYIKTFTSKLISDKTIDFLFTNNVYSGIGTALAACVTFNINNQHPENLLFELQSLVKQKSQIFCVKNFIKLLDNKQTSFEATKLAYQYLKELKFDLPISVVWAYYFMNGPQEEADKLFKENPVSMGKVNFLICQKIKSTSNIELCKVYKDFTKQHCTDGTLIIKIFRWLFDFLVYGNQYDEAITLIQDLAELDISLGNLRLTSLTKVHDFWLKNKSRYENVSAFFLPDKVIYNSNSDSDFD